MAQTSVPGQDDREQPDGAVSPKRDSAVVRTASGRSEGHLPPGSVKSPAGGDGRAAAATEDGAKPRPVQIQVPERPRLAASVKLAGQMQESAFIDPPWLLEREGAGYIQVTRLLYCVAEHCDGQSSLAEIARKVSDATGRAVSADNVKTLVAKQLLLKGLVTGPDGKPLVRVAAGSRSPLAVNMKMKTLGPEAVEPLVNVLKILFWPPVLLALLIATALAQAWMYLVHGVSGGLHDALYAPGWLLAILGVIVLAAGFHELGHAAALHYGGGKVKGMGAGIYLVYPAFYTDVSDNYRLGRWARVRTDLGGFYFNLIFALGIVGLYLLSGQEFLLLIVVLINFEIIHQLLPFVRLDGYWTLADITGIPDFFSQMAAFVRSVLPFKKVDGRKLPELKRWAKVVFALYILVTIPLLLFVLAIMIKGLPRVLATAWDSLGQQAQAFSGALGAGQALGAAAAAVQIIALGLPTLGLLYTLYSLGRRLLTAVWGWSASSPGRRAVGVLGLVGVAGSLAYFWAPQLPSGDTAGPLQDQARWQPIRREERGTVFDVLGATPPGSLAPAERASPPAQPSPSPAPQLGPPVQATAAATVVPEQTPTAGATAEPTPLGTSLPTPEATVGATLPPTTGSVPPSAPSRPLPAPAPPVAPAAPPAIPAPAPPAAATPAGQGAPGSAPTAPATVLPAGSTPARLPTFTPGAARTPTPIPVR